MKLGHLLGIAFSIIVLTFSTLHALSGGIQGALLSRENPGQGALWGAIGAAGSEVAMEAVYDAKARSEAISEGMKARVKKGELAQMLAEAGLEMPQLDQGGETVSRQGIVTRSQARTQQERSDLFKAQVEAALKEVFTQKLRADVERSRNLVRLGMSGVALAAGVEGPQMSMMDDMADQALTHNFAQMAVPVGLAALEAAMPGLLAAAAGALGVTYAWDAVTGLFSASTDQGVELPFNTMDDKLPVKGKPGNRAQEIGQSTAGGMMPEDPNDHNEEEPRESKPAKVNKQKPKQPGDLYNKNNKGKFVRKLKEHEKGFGARDKNRKEETSIKAAQIEKTGEQIEIAKQRGVTYNHGKKVNEHQQGLLKLEKRLEKEMEHIDNILTHQSKHPQIPEVQKYRNWLERFKGNVRNKFEITNKKYPFDENNVR